MTASATPFDVCGALPTGTALLEASAGTGKTFTIAALATRIVAEGHAELSQLMLVTFSRAATAELRERVREHLSSAYTKLGDPSGASADPHDSVAQLLATGTGEEIAQRRHRLRLALSAFDAATIATTHGFCHQMLLGLGSVGDSDEHEVLVEQVDDVVDEALTDRWVRRFGRVGALAPTIGFRSARTVARAAVADRQARPVPADAANGSAAQLRYEIAQAVRNEVQARKRARYLLDYDDQLTRLRDALVDPATGEIACERLRERYRYVLVDEFQDTDPVQWQILKTAFHGHTTLILIGDPKQAIYAFRGADVYAYLAAAEVATTQLDLARNWRSDAELVRALHAVYGGSALGDPRIVARHVDAEHTDRRLTAGPNQAPLRLRLVPRNHFELMSNGLPAVSKVRPWVAGDLAADVVRLLDSPARLALDERPLRPVAPGDIAVLVRTHVQAGIVHEALRNVGVPAVLTGQRSIFSSAPAREWLTLLRALEQPSRSGPVRSAALTSFVGWNATRLATAPENEVEDLGRRMREWRDVLVERGVAALYEVVSGSERLTERVLGRRRGERDLTDLQHVGQVLHHAMQTEGLGAMSLAEWLQRRISDAQAEITEERSRRLETDSAAVQVVTIHTSKGLEFPIVYLPFGWDRPKPSTPPETTQFHGPDGERLLFVGGEHTPGSTEARMKSAAEDDGEDLRMLYVAMTRAQCQVVAWWAGTKNTTASALHRLLLGPRIDGAEPPASVPVKLDVDVRKALKAWAEAAGECVSLEEAAPPGSITWSPGSDPPGELSAAVWDRTLDMMWRRTSYSGLTAAVHDDAVQGGVASEPEAEDRQDEPPTPIGAEPSTPDGEAALRAVQSPMADLPTGTAFGTIVHRVLETINPTAPDLETEVRAVCARVLAGRLAQTMTADDLAAGLLPALQTPLGPLAGSRTLAGIRPEDRLAELAFELPLAGGDRPKGVNATISTIAGLLRRHLSPDDPFASYPNLLDVPGLREQALRGYLTGSIDAVLRLPAGARPRYVVVDYKTNWLGQFGPEGALPLTAWDYRPEALTSAMLHAHYPLQAMLYLVALHRYLRWRQPSYDPAIHLGGVLYLFVRGMCGPSTPVIGGVPTGVLSWRPAPALVVGLSRLLDTGDLR
jgi:exodeoxyribonuclease V beta subunit